MSNVNYSLKNKGVRRLVLYSNAKRKISHKILSVTARFPELFIGLRLILIFIICYFEKIVKSFLA